MNEAPKSDDAESVIDVLRTSWRSERSRRATTQKLLHRSFECSRQKRLGHICGRAGLQGGITARSVASCGQNNNRNIPVVIMRLDESQDVQSMHVRHVQIKNHKVH